MFYINYVIELGIYYLYHGIDAVGGIFTDSGVLLRPMTEQEWGIRVKENCRDTSNELKIMIHSIRDAGLPVCSSNDGEIILYFRYSGGFARISKSMPNNTALLIMYLPGAPESEIMKPKLRQDLTFGREYYMMGCALDSTWRDANTARDGAMLTRSYTFEAADGNKASKCAVDHAYREFNGMEMLLFAKRLGEGKVQVVHL